MRTRAFLTYPYTVDVWNFIVVDADNNTLSYSYQETISVGFASSPTSPRVVIECDRPFGKRIKLLNVRDRNGVEVMPGAEYSVTRTIPVLNTYGFLEGYRMEAALSNDPQFEVANA